MARRLAADGDAVAVNYASSAAEADALVAEPRARGACAIAVRADISKADEVRAMFVATERELGRVDVLVNNAGVLKMKTLAQTSDALYDQTFDINVRGTFNTLREAATRLNDGGRIVSFSSPTVNAVAPGPVANALFFDGKTQEQIQALANMPPLQRLGEPGDIASVVGFLVSPAGGWISGQVLRANGGLA